jgi:hypothetical protein
MQRVIAWFILGPALIGCGAVEDRTTVYVVPENCTGADWRGPVCPQGDYPADTSFKIVYEIDGPSAGEIKSQTCSIEQTGEFVLTVHTSWRARDNADAVGSTYFDCDDMTPPLAAGKWTIRHGDSSSILTIPSTQTYTVCVWSDDDCTEILWGE